MARTRNIPNLPVLGDGNEILAGGKAELFEAGTSTPKVAYKNAAGTSSYGSVIDFDSAGRPDEGAIFWDGMYKVVVYGYENGSYVLKYTVDNFGDNSSAIIVTGLGVRPLNWSFETDDNADDIPDYWTITTSGGTAVRTLTDNYHGTASLAFTSASGAEYAESSFFEVSPGENESISFAVKASNASAEPQIDLVWYDKDQSLISSTTVYDSDTGETPTSWSFLNGATASPPSTARYAKLKIIGNNNASSYTVYFDKITSVAIGTETLAPYTPRGLLLSNSSGDAVNDITISEGQVRDTTNSDNISLSAITKRADASFSVGTGNGAMATGASYIASELYSVHAIKNSLTGVSDILFDQGVSSFSSPTLPTGFDLSRLIGFFITYDNGGTVTIESFIHSGDFFRLLDPVNQVTDTTIVDDVFEEATCTVPPNCLAHFYVKTGNLAGNDEVQVGLRPKGAADGGPAGNVELFGFESEPVGGTGSNNFATAALCFVDEDSKIEYSASEGSAASNVTIRLIGVIMVTRSNP